MKIIHKKEKCIGCGLCVAMCPKLFEINNENNLVNLKNSHETDGVFELEITENENAKQATENCPVQAIEIINNN